MIEVKRLKVFYNNRIVGYLEELENQVIAFQYDLNWIDTGFSISPFSLPLKSNVFISKSPHFDGLFGVFRDSLPDGFGELLVRKMFQKKGLNYDKVSVLTRLSILSDNSLGALTYEPSQIINESNNNMDLDLLAAEAKQLFDEHKEPKDFDYIYQVGGSSGGARPKAHITIDKTEWIIKFPSSIDPKEIGYLEYTANDLALKSGIKVNDFYLFKSKKCKGYFGAKRFDRLNGEKIHMISLSSLLETSHRLFNLDYGHLFQVTQEICYDFSDMYEVFKRMCFNVVYGNKDDHGKNFAFLYNEAQNGYELSPFYDITETKNIVEHSMTISNNGNPTEKDLLDLAKEFNLSMKKCQDILNCIKKTLNKNV